MRNIYGIAGAVAALIALPAGLVVLAGAIVVLIFATAQTDTGGDAQLAGLDGPVTILRDTHAVPHIFADSQLDAYRALGFVHAQDRFFQMEFTRRTAAGRLSEVIGPLGLPGDRFMRTLGIYKLAEASVGSLSPEARAVVEAYSQGGNAWLT
ncbi:MAG: penicillin acylase family protein, partial [Rhodospirillaceae bacterium]|nr:penicillin acylase family protein [Rhodospirillaceae bacterium]